MNMNKFVRFRKLCYFAAQWNLITLMPNHIEDSYRYIAQKTVVSHSPTNSYTTVATAIYNNLCRSKQPSYFRVRELDVCKRNSQSR